MAYTDSIFRSKVGRSVDRDALQHNRINDRIGPQSRFQTAGTLIFQPDLKSDFYVNDKQRFNKDFNQHDKIKREHSRIKQQNFYDLRKQKRLQKDEQRWSNIHNRDVYNEKKRLYHQEVLLDNKRNSNGLPYNPISLDYEKSNKGEHLRKIDQDKEVRRLVRAQNIITKNNTGYNIITGEDKPTMKKYVPENLRPKVEQIIKSKVDQRVKYVPVRDKYDYLDD